jgi:hypothetical protein
VPGFGAFSSRGGNGGHGPCWVELQRGPRVVPGEGVPLPFFTQNVIAPIFFEIIQPKGSELDQMRRGVL